MKTSLIVIIALVAGLLTPTLAQQKLENIDRERARIMLRTIADDVRKHYYDPKLHGFDLDGRVKEAEERLKEAQSLSKAFTIIAWMLEGLEDSHTVFIPPTRTYRTAYGWRMQMIGDRCYVVHVQPGSDAETKGLTPGDEILDVNGTAPTRESFPLLQYYYNVLSPHGSLRVLVSGRDGQKRQLEISAKVRELQRSVDLTGTGGVINYYSLLREAEDAAQLTRTRCAEVGEQLTICKMAEFDMGQDQVQSILRTIRKHKSVIIDLRGNPGGSVETLGELLGGFFDHQIRIGDRVGRKEMRPQVSTLQRDTFSGEMVVLVDSQSASAAELFAHVMQLEKRAAVIGDYSAGQVMEAKAYQYQIGIGTVVFYAALITDADIVMSDGKSLEHVGVAPDEVLLPSAADLAVGRDPVLAHAAERLGYKLSPEQAGKLFPYQWANN